MAEKRIFDIQTEATIDDITEKVYAWFDKKAQQGEVQEPSWKFDVYLLVKILNNFATKFVPNVATVEGKCYWHDGELYVCDTAYTGDWVPGNFTATSIDDLFARKDVLTALLTDVGNLQSALETTNGNVENVAHSIAPEFDGTRTSENPYRAGECVMNNGALYRFKVDHYGPWSSSDVSAVTASSLFMINLDLNDKSLWKTGIRSSTTGQPRFAIDTGLITEPFYFDAEPVITFTRAEEVSFRFAFFFFDAQMNFLATVGDATTSSWNLSSLLAAYPSAKFISVSIENVSGATVSPSNLENILTFNDVGQCTIYGYKDVFRDNAEKNELKQNITYNLDLNESKYWIVAGIDRSGIVDAKTLYSDRVVTIPLKLSYDSVISYALKPGVTLNALRVYAYASDGTFLGYKQNVLNISEIIYSYPTATMFRISLFGISGTTAKYDTVSNVATFAKTGLNVVGVDGDDVIDSSIIQSDYVYALPKKSITKLKPKTVLPCFSFVFDDVYDDRDIVSLFDSKGVKCGFAFIARDDVINFQAKRYLDWHNKGYEILNHSIDANTIDQTNYPTYEDAYLALLTAKNRLETVGFVVNGFVAPSSTVRNDYKSIIGKLHAYGFINVNEDNTQSTPVDNLKRYSIQATHDIETIKAYIDDCIANNRYCCFYGHARDFGTGDWSLEKLESVVDYLIAKRNLGLCNIGTPTDMVKLYYGL